MSTQGPEQIWFLEIDTNYTLGCDLPVPGQVHPGDTTEAPSHARPSDSVTEGLRGAITSFICSIEPPGTAMRKYEEGQRMVARIRSLKVRAYLGYQESARELYGYNTVVYLNDKNKSNYEEHSVQVDDDGRRYVDIWTPGLVQTYPFLSSQARIYIKEISTGQIVESLRDMIPLSVGEVRTIELISELKNRSLTEDQAELRRALDSFKYKYARLLKVKEDIDFLLSLRKGSGISEQQIRNLIAGLDFLIRTNCRTDRHRNLIFTNPGSGAEIAYHQIAAIKGKFPHLTSSYKPKGNHRALQTPIHGGRNGIPQDPIVALLGL